VTVAFDDHAVHAADVNRGRIRDAVAWSLMMMTFGAEERRPRVPACGERRRAMLDEPL